MNATPCPLCNFLALKRYQAFLKREYKELERYETEHEQHQARCVILRGGWYLGLWPTARLAPQGELK